MAIIDKGNYYELPLQNYRISGFEFSPRLYLRLTNDALENAKELFLSIDCEYELNRHGQPATFSSPDPQGWKQLIDLYGKVILKAKAYKKGDLFLELQHHCELVIREGDYESWILHIENIPPIRPTWVWWRK